MVTALQINDAHLVFNGPAPSAGKQKTIDTIIIHHRAGNGDVQSIHTQHRAQGWWGIGYHYYIRRDGSIWKGRPEEFCGSHAGASSGYNTHSIGICFEGNLDKDQMTDEQVASGRELIADIRRRYSIDRILRHSDVAATGCPGKNCRFEELISTAPAQKETVVKVGSTTVPALLIDGTTYVPLRGIVSALCERLVVTWSKDAGAAVELK